MAKELPYLKWEPAAWDNGNIQMCSHTSKGIFADLISLYWSRLGEVPYALALQKLCNGNADLFSDLLKHEIFSISNEQIVIKFLDEQLAERGIISEKRREAAEKRWGDANALQMESKSNAKRREEKREKKKRGEKIAAPEVPFLGEVLNSWNEWVKYRAERKQSLTPASIKKQIQFLGGRGDPEIMQIIDQSIRNGYQGLFELKKQYNGSGTKIAGIHGQKPAGDAGRKPFGNL